MKEKSFLCSCLVGILVTLFITPAFAGSRPAATMEPPAGASTETVLLGEPAMIGSHVIIEAPNVEPQSTNFFEVWAYLVAGSEEYLKTE